MTRKPAVGDRYLLDAVSTSDGRIERRHTVTVSRVEQLGCNCYRLHARRPGPENGPLGILMHLIVNRCPWHQANSPDGTEEPQRVTEDVSA